MENIFFTLAGTKHYFGDEFLQPGMNVQLKKEPENEYDKEAIMVTVWVRSVMLPIAHMGWTYSFGWELQHEKQRGWYQAIRCRRGCK